jgi:hypothetical protein
MQPTDMTIEILKGIRDEVHGLREDTHAHFGETNARLSRLERRQTDADVRVSTLLTGVAGAVDEMRDLLRNDRVLRGRVDDHERRLGALERRG